MSTDGHIFKGRHLQDIYASNGVPFNSGHFKGSKSYTFTYVIPALVKSDKWDANYNELLTFRTLHDFFAIYNTLDKPSRMPPGSKYLIFREGIKPEWEDERNRDGHIFRLEFSPKDMTYDEYKRIVGNDTTDYKEDSKYTPDELEEVKPIIEFRKWIDHFWLVFPVAVMEDCVEIGGMGEFTNGIKITVGKDRYSYSVEIWTDLINNIRGMSDSNKGAGTEKSEAEVKVAEEEKKKKFMDFLDNGLDLSKFVYRDEVNSSRVRCKSMPRCGEPKVYVSKKVDVISISEKINNAQIKHRRQSNRNTGRGRNRN